MIPETARWWGGLWCNAGVSASRPVSRCAAMDCMVDDPQCEHGPGYVCGLCMEPAEEERPCHEDPGACDYDCPRFAVSHAGF